MFTEYTAVLTTTKTMNNLHSLPKFHRNTFYCPTETVTQQFLNNATASNAWSSQNALRFFNFPKNHEQPASSLTSLIVWLFLLFSFDQFPNPWCSMKEPWFYNYPKNHKQFASSSTPLMLVVRLLFHFYWFNFQWRELCNDFWNGIYFVFIKSKAS